MEHSDIPAGEMHAPHNWRVADEAARLALAPTADDLGKYLWQQSDDTEWLLVAAGPAVWKQHVGPKGADGREVELRRGATYVQWRRVGDSTWQDLVSLADLTGAPGSDGDDGQNIELQTTATHIQWRVVGSATWIDLVALSTLTGPPGNNGNDGREVEFQKSTTHIQWRYVGSPWTNLVALADITGANGQNIELQKSATHIQWRVVGTSTWADLVALADLQGPAGSDATVNAANVASVLHGAAGKTTPVDADELPLADSEATWGLKKLTWANAKATLLAYLKGQFREKLSAARTYYVRTDGNDSNTGLANTAGGAFLTIQKAVDVVAMLDLSIFDVTINVGTGTYGPVILKSCVGAGNVSIVGDTGTLTNCVIAGGSGSAIETLGVCRYSISGFTLSGVRGVMSSEGSIISIGAIRAASITNRFLYVHRGGKVYITGNIVLSSNMSYFAVVESQGALLFSKGLTVTLTGTPAFVYFLFVSFAYAEVASATFSGSATGTRYIIGLNGAIYTGLAGEGYLPGSVNGTKSDGGQYT